MKLIDNVSQCHRLWSIRLALLIAALNAGVGGWSLFQGVVNPLLYAGINMALGLGVALARVVAQQPKDGNQS